MERETDVTRRHSVRDAAYVFLYLDKHR